MIVHIPLNDVATLTVGITDQMQQDLLECKRLSETNDCNGKDCNVCSWNDLEINGDGLCCYQRIIDAVMAAGKDDGNGKDIKENNK